MLTTVVTAAPMTAIDANTITVVASTLVTATLFAASAVGSDTAIVEMPLLVLQFYMVDVMALLWPLLLDLPLI